MDLSVSIALAASFIIFLTPLPPATAGGVTVLEDAKSTFSEIRVAINEIRETAGGVWRFLESISSAVRTIARLVDPRALALLFFVLLFSAGFAAIGIPRGRQSFFLSLALADALWFVWGKSMDEEMPSYALSMALVNLYLLSPYLLYLLLRRSVPPAAGRALAALRRRWTARKPAERGYIRRIARDIDDESLRLIASLSRDLAETGKEEAVTLSGESKGSITRLRDTLDRLYRIGSEE